MSAGTGVAAQRVQRLAERRRCTSCRSGSSLPGAGIAPGYEQKAFAEADKRGRLRLVASPDGAEDSLTIHQDARVYATVLAPGQAVAHSLARGRHAWVQVTRGDADGRR